jgi:hypothetical protein
MKHTSRLPEPCKEGLGTSVEKALILVGITKDRVEKWLGQCKCQERKEKLNLLSNWAQRAINGKIKSASQWLQHILNG